MTLTWKSSWDTGIDNLDALEGMQLTALYCDANQISDLTPLKGMPLNLLNCGGNDIRSLKPLETLQLTVLHCGDNLVTDLSPLQDMTMTMLSCHCNLISDMSPVKGMPLAALTCGGNQLTSIGHLEENPPDDFLYDCETLSVEYLRDLLERWSTQEHLGAHRRNAAVSLALKEQDLQALRLMASEFRGQKYLFLPEFLEWVEAKEYCEALGGHLVTIMDKEENDFIASMFPGGSWFWIGLVTTRKGHQWVTHEPFEFSAFEDKVRERMLGPKVFFSGAWSRDVHEQAHNCFIIKWDK